MRQESIPSHRKSLFAAAGRVRKHVELYALRLRLLPKSQQSSIVSGGVLLIAIVIGLLIFKNAPKPASLPTDSEIPSVGVTAFKTVVLDQPDHTSAPPSSNAPLAVKIIAIEPLPRGGFAYKLSYTGMECGVFNLTDFLVTPDGNRLKEPIATVTIASVIPPDADYKAVHTQPPLQQKAFPYKLVSILSALVWAGCGAMLFWPRQTLKRDATPLSLGATQTDAEPATPVPPVMLADILRPLVERAANKSITAAEKARLESILFQYWGKELELDHLNSVEQLRRILEHPGGGALLRTIEQWLYQPDSQISEDEIASALKDYLEIPSPETHSHTPPQNHTSPASENVSTVLSS